MHIYAYADCNFDEFVHFSDVAHTESADAIVGMVSHHVSPLGPVILPMSPSTLLKDLGWEDRLPSTFFSAAILVLTGIQRFDMFRLLRLAVYPLSVTSGSIPIDPAIFQSAPLDSGISTPKSKRWKPRKLIHGKHEPPFYSLWFCNILVPQTGAFPHQKLTSLDDFRVQ